MQSNDFESFMDKFISYLSVSLKIPRKLLLTENNAGLRLLREAREDGLVNTEVDKGDI